MLKQFANFALNKMLLSLEVSNQGFFLDSRLLDRLLHNNTQVFQLSSYSLWFPSMKTNGQFTESCLDGIHWYELWYSQSSKETSILDVSDYLGVMVADNHCLLKVKKFLVCGRRHDIFVFLDRRELKAMANELCAILEWGYTRQLIL